MYSWSIFVTGTWLRLEAKDPDIPPDTGVGRTEFLAPTRSAEPESAREVNVVLCCVLLISWYSRIFQTVLAETKEYFTGSSSDVSWGSWSETIIVEKDRALPTQRHARWTCETAARVWWSRLPDNTPIPVATGFSPSSNPSTVARRCYCVQMPTFQARVRGTWSLRHSSPTVEEESDWFKEESDWSASLSCVNNMFKVDTYCVSSLKRCVCSE